MFALWSVVAVFASDDEAPAEEIVVWGDPFARWERRWYVETEVHFADPLKLFGWVNTEIDVMNLQVRAVLSCDKDFELGPKTMEVHCDIEDIGLVVMPRLVSDNDAELVGETDATLTDAAIQLQVSEVGRVPDVDLENVAAHNTRTRQRQEQLRQLMSRVILPFHLALPETVLEGSKWYEYNSRLMTMPSATGSAGSAVLAHYLDRMTEELFVVQSIGHGTIRPIGGIEAMASDANGMNMMIGLPVDIYELDMHGVALIERDTGIMNERVWVVSGGLTPSSPGALSGRRYYHMGRIRMLGETEHPDVGPTVVVSRTDGRDADRPTWVSLEP